MKRNELRDFLEKASSPNHNIFLWKLLKTKALVKLTINKSNKVNENVVKNCNISDKVNENVVKNCNKTQIDELMKEIGFWGTKESLLNEIKSA